ncbi:MAG: prepilin-type N-terminal cleavage/methylation domain-containing protein [Ruminococcus sp.]|nr:prepilin-type N-terminal cleavage/methylation domain-containing protein [Ruminococcus sp.]MDE6848192.1 prepilin-type N-terminal cleavage/methylation domain-containing protein [Ruminococcus sp.]MDE7138134.1 prepilin-type N-terminal cleavage/methylation domain-containing protein [Ruminococcus sp.]
MKSKRNLKGFTLVELIVVMAVFGLIMLGAMQFLSPVNRMMKGASVQEANSATVDNIKRYLEGTLRYANAVYVHNGDLKYYDVSGCHLIDPSMSESARQQEAVEEFVDSCFTNRVDSSNDPISGKVYVMKIDNDNQGRITESEFNFTAGYDYNDWNPSTSLWDDTKRHSASVSAVTIDAPVINEAYYSSYSIFATIGYNEMKAIHDGDVSYALPAKIRNDQYFGRIVPVGSYGFSPSMFSMTFVTYKNSDGADQYHHVIDGEHVFGSPYSSANASLALLNINSAFGGDYRANLDYCPVRRNGNGYSPTDPVDDDGDTKWDYVRLASSPDYFSSYDIPNDIGGNNIYIIYTLPE